MTDALALDRIVVDEEKCFQREAELISDRLDIFDLIVPVDAPSDEIVRRHKRLARIMILVFPQRPHRGLFVLAYAGEQDAAL